LHEKSLLLVASRPSIPIIIIIIIIIRENHSTKTEQRRHVLLHSNISVKHIQHFSSTSNVWHWKLSISVARAMFDTENSASVQISFKVCSTLHVPETLAALPPDTVPGILYPEMYNTWPLQIFNITRIHQCFYRQLHDSGGQFALQAAAYTHSPVKCQVLNSEQTRKLPCNGPRQTVHWLLWYLGQRSLNPFGVAIWNTSFGSFHLWINVWVCRQNYKSPDNMCHIWVFLQWGSLMEALWMTPESMQAKY